MRLESDKFQIEISRGGVITSMRDARDGFVSQLVKPDGVIGAISYTLKTNDITSGDKPRFSPYVAKSAEYDSVRLQNGIIFSSNEELSAEASYALTKDGICISAEIHNDNVSQFGLSMPFNFMGSLGGGDFWHQILPLSPYASEDNRYLFYYFSKPDGNNLAVIAQTEIDGWKIDYSPYVWGHYIIGITFLASFDRAYKQIGRMPKNLKLHVVAVQDFEDALQKFAAIKNISVAFLPVSGGLTGASYPVKVYGKNDGLIVKDAQGERRIIHADGKAAIPIRASGFTRITPYCGENPGADALFCGYDSFRELYAKSCRAVKQADLDKTDGNLCEHQCWASAAMRYMMFSGQSDDLSAPVKQLLREVMQADSAKAIVRRTLCAFAQNGFPSYNMFRSGRIQEAFFGVGILLDAWKLYGEKHCLDYAAAAAESLLRQYLQASGEIRRKYLDDGTPYGEDYTTVTCMIIPIIDLYLGLKRLGDCRAEFMRTCADKIAGYVNKRGFCFPTEGGVTNLAQEQMEEGSISCSALTLLYYCTHVRYQEEYIKTAESFLSLHDAFVMSSPDCRQNGSTLRWWETLWEGDADGPALCCGHAWTIWRAEADFWLALSRFDAARLIKSYNGFMSNLAKIDSEGRSYAAFVADYITGGGLADTAEQAEFEIKRGMPKQTDSGLSRYVFSRASDTWCRLTAVIRTSEFCGALNGHLDGGILTSDAPAFDKLFISGYTGNLRVKCTTAPEIITTQEYSLKKTPHYLEINLKI